MKYQKIYLQGSIFLFALLLVSSCDFDVAMLATDSLKSENTTFIKVDGAKELTCYNHENNIRRVDQIQNNKISSNFCVPAEACNYHIKQQDSNTIQNNRENKKIRDDSMVSWWNQE